jgi:TolA-binding protein
MSPKKVKLTKHQMKEDKLVTTTFQFTEYIQKHSRKFLIAGAGVVVLILIGIFIISSNRARKQKALELLGKARVELQAGEFQQATSDLQTIWRNYGGTRAGQEALYLLGNTLYYNRDYDLAMRYFQDFTTKYPKAEPLLLSGALSGIGDCHMQRKEYSQAAEYYLKAADKNPNDFGIPDLLLLSAQAYSYANQPDRAKEIYEKIIQKYPDSKTVFQARLELAELTAKKS